jgi:hypothetical protein
MKPRARLFSLIFHVNTGNILSTNNTYPFSFSKKRIEKVYFWYSCRNSYIILNLFSHL